MTPEFRAAQSTDAETLLAFMREFNASQEYPFEAPAARRALLELLGSPALGRVWLIVAEGAPVGYVALTLGFSLEYGGRDAFIDELFLRPPFRRRGFGKAALSFALAEASRLGVQAVHLEVERANPAAHGLYLSLGFVSKNRQLLTRQLTRRSTGGDR